MKIVVDHLTRMQSGYFCAAGVDVRTKKHVRPMPARGHLRGTLLAPNGGPFDMAAILDLGAVKPCPEPPQTEDVSFQLESVKHAGTLAGPRFWNMVTQMARPRLTEIFGSALTPRGRNSCGVDVGRGAASLGCLIPAGRPELHLQQREGRPAQIRIRMSDGVFDLDLSVTDVRLYGSDRLTTDWDAFQRVLERLGAEDDVVLGVGLTRPYAPSAEQVPIHWLQVNNIHFKDDQVWRLKTDEQDAGR